MAPRISRAHTGVTKAKNPKKRSRARALDAFAIASAENPDVPKLARNRLGQPEEAPRDRKRRRIEDEDDEDMQASDADADERPRLQRRRQVRRASVGSSEKGSDSEGNTWTMGHVDKEDDSDIDSDEAFAEGDEERFAGYAFSGSAQNKRQRAWNKGPSEAANGDINLDDDKPRPESDDESLGEDAIDLAQMLDDYEESGDEVGQRPESASEDDSESDNEGQSSHDELSGSEDDSDSINDDEFAGFSSEDNDGLDPAKMSKLQGLISSLHPKTAEEEKRTSAMYESTNPSEAGITLAQKVDVRSILNFGSSQPESKKASKKKDLKLAPALPKLQQDKLDRVAANEKAKTTLDRWVDTVKQMRRAEHVTFPLQDSESRPASDTAYLLPSITGAPITDLEATISNILQESGLGPDQDEEEDGEYDELPANEVSVQDVLERRAQLRRARELIFREEQRAKRVKKIKSKSYRRVHRKERERLEALDRDAFGSDAEIDDEEREAHDRRRAEERMGAKHRNSKWAKQMKKSGRSIWDDEARSGVTEMARRDEELRRRIAGKDVRDAESGGESSSSSDDEVDEATSQLQRLHKNLKKLQEEEEEPGQASGSGIASMKFMRRAEEAHKAQNDEDIKRMRRELDGEESSEIESEDESHNIGRQIFGPSMNKKTPKEQPEERNEFEEPENTDDESDEHITLDTALMVDPTVLSNGVSQDNLVTNPYSKPQASKARNKNSGFKAPAEKSASNPSNKQNGEREILSQPDSAGWITVTYEKDSDSEKAASDAESALDQAEFLSKAFAGDDVEEQFAQEKEEVIIDEDDKIIDETLPGWGAWVGEGISRRERQRNKGRKLVKREGIKRQDRRDAKLQNVIINQKRVRKNASYLAPTLPFPFTSRQEYERAMRMPIGGEWNVKRTVGERTKPRVLVKPGRVVLPMEKPLV